MRKSAEESERRTQNQQVAEVAIAGHIARGTGNHCKIKKEVVGISLAGEERRRYKLACSPLLARGASYTGVIPSPGAAGDL
ncbi:hypothetical protein EVAR_6454_1 [Eumeta japonica]|uniref:Uncharacterized protein n=1 Tax=Eumeta variegata TaxID=151549 RepID=A0A4C1SS88_EUMVA|nr:hypothetical protein EVAR_6454_1 [Eumeta japonica]